MNKSDKKQRNSLIKQLEKKGINPTTQSLDSTEYNQIIKKHFLSTLFWKK